MIRWKEGPRRQGKRRTQRARDLRKRMTDAERKLWLALRSSQMEGVKFRRQVPFGPFYLDFYWAAKRIALEVDGNHHAEPLEKASDQERTTFLQEKGLTVLRYTDREVLLSTDAVLADLMNRMGNPHPDPLLFKERE